MTEPIDPFKQSALVQALLIAPYALVIHDGMKVTSEGRSWKLDFSGELTKIAEALEGAGIDTTTPILAPVKWVNS
ncbi:hypothetical protein [Paraburkholderia youngii]|uniref:Uncharacterized protein n=1 Tax=Paraburkholderia youngii TaxID=2782701 RepID=A0ABX2NPI2_9BURK|nr:hypothetical protein [Paraburkholderia youngii]NVI06334.1 hypothetical protein [Paraburkholderia youngii]